MTKTEAIARIEATLPALTAAQTEALAQLADAWTRQPQPEDAGTRAAIAEGLAQADRGEFVEPAKVSAVLGTAWN
jgi:predicted transcriptional regulator